MTPEPQNLSPTAYLRWHKDDSDAAMTRYDAQFPQTGRFLHPHEVVDVELDHHDSDERTRRRRYGHTEEGKSLAVGRTREPQARTYSDRGGLRPEGDRIPLGDLADSRFRVRRDVTSDDVLALVR